MASFPWIKFYVNDWLSDPRLRSCSPATRGIWIDLLCSMHLLDRCGEVSGTIDQLARMANCSTAEMATALIEFQTTKTADIFPPLENTEMLHVTLCNKIVTVKNRRMLREAKIRKQSNLRVERHRRNARRNAPVTAHIQNHISESEEEPPISPRGGMSPDGDGGEKDLFGHARGNGELPKARAIRRTRAHDVIDLLNRESGKRFEYGKPALAMIEARFKDGATMADFESIVKHKNGQWGNDAERREYLRPATLFCPKHWHDYLAAARDTVKPHKPPWEL